MDRVHPADQISDYYTQAATVTGALGIAGASAPAPAANTPSPLIRTKLHPPVTRTALVSRPRLHERLAEGLRRPLTLVTAPAGFGKTTLVASSLAHCGMRVGWLALDKNDNLPGRFVTYLVAALRESNPGVGSEAAQLVSAQASPEAILTSIINELDTMDVASASDASDAGGGEIVLVLDDYQFVSSGAVHEEVVFLLEHCPSTLHIVIATRSDPPFPLARLRARGQAVELRAADLSFTEEEAAQFLNEVMGLRLDVASVGALQERTEGWIAGLQMAALSMRDRKDVVEFLQGFSGTNRYILDYLLEEVLAGQPPDTQHFLLYTSVLERLSAPLCDALLDSDQSASTLEYLERANLFLVPLDDERQWFRYHHLFADLLRTRLGHLYPIEIPGLHRRASTWYEKHDLMEEAVGHALAAEDFEGASRLLNAMAKPMIARSAAFKLSHWIAQLPDSYVRTRPWLCVALAWVYGYQGLMSEQEDYLNEAERHIDPGDPQSAQRELRGHVLALRSLAASTAGDFPEMIRLGEEALGLVSTDDIVVRVTVGYNLGRTYLTLGDFAGADRELWETVRLCTRAGVHHILAPTIANISRAYRLQGLLRKSLESVRPLQTYVEEHNPKGIHAAPYVYIGNIEVSREWNHLQEAEEMARQMLPALQPWKSQNCTCACATLLARVLQAQGRLGEARDMLQWATQEIERNVPFGDIRSDLNAARVRYWLETGELSPAECWVGEWRKTHNEGERFSIIGEQDQISACRVLIATDQFCEASEKLSHLAESAEAGGRNGRLIEIGLLLAKSLNGQRRTTEALQALDKCLALAEPEGYLRIFLDEGRPMQMLLAHWLAHTGAGPLRDYVAYLLAQFGAEPRYAVAQIAYPARGAASATHPLRSGPECRAEPPDSEQALWALGPGAAVAVGWAEPLSGRELEVLNLMALGKTNAEIAGQLIISVGTVKAHTANIYQKLDAGNRTEAVARARQLGILP